MKFDANKPTHLISCANAIGELHNAERKIGKNQIDSFMGMLSLANELAQKLPVSFLGFSLGELLTNNGATNPGMGVWLGIGPIKPETNYYNTVICIHVEMLALGRVKHTPVIYTNLSTPININVIKLGVKSAIESISFEFDVLEGEETEADDFAKFMKNLGVN